MKKTSILVLCIIATMVLCGNVFASGWEGPYGIGAVQASPDGSVFFKTTNPDGSINDQTPCITQSQISADNAKGFRDILLTAFNSGKRVLLYVTEIQPNGWKVVNHIQVGNY